jgi:hypothetical protein
MDLDCEVFAREKVAPMVRGLFPVIEQQAVLDMLARLLSHPKDHRGCAEREAIPEDGLAPREPVPAQLRRKTFSRRRAGRRWHERGHDLLCVDGLLSFK